jgi:cytoskeletal protein CcmA (bactofilin family)
MFRWVSQEPATRTQGAGGAKEILRMADYESIRQHWSRVGLSKRSAADADVANATPCETSSPNGTFISSGAIFEGILSLKGDFHIDTEFRGELETDGTITIGPKGSVVGSIRGREVVIRGAVVGNVTAPRQLIVEATGKLHGNIETACLEIQKHAFFQGTTSMTLPQASRRNASPVVPDADSLHAPI